MLIIACSPRDHDGEALRLRAVTAAVALAALPHAVAVSWTRTTAYAATIDADAADRATAAMEAACDRPVTFTPARLPVMLGGIVTGAPGTGPVEAGLVLGDLPTVDEAAA